jgi:hypothetical protein
MDYAQKDSLCRLGGQGGAFLGCDSLANLNLATIFIANMGVCGANDTKEFRNRWRVPFICLPFPLRIRVSLAVAILAIIQSKTNAFPTSTVIIEQYRPPIDKFIIGEFLWFDIRLKLKLMGFSFARTSGR